MSKRGKGTPLPRKLFAPGKPAAAPDPRKLLLLLLLGTVFFLIPKAYLGDTFPLCLYRLLLGRECPGCGITRAVWSVLHLKFADAWEYNKLIVVVFPLLLGCAAKWTTVRSGKK